MIGCQLHQNPATFYFNLSVFSQGKFKIWSAKVREFQIVLRLQCINICKEIKEYNNGFCSYEPPNFADKRYSDILGL